MADIVKGGVNVAELDYGVKKSYEGLKRNFHHLKLEYSEYIQCISKSGRDGDDPSLYHKPDFFDQLHKLEHNKVRQVPPSILHSTETTDEAVDYNTISRTESKLDGFLMINVF